jgi:3-oxoacyl-[acyl-carrier-protein] synthase II
MPSGVVRRCWQNSSQLASALMQNARMDPSQIGWIRSCGTGARDLDAAEAIALNAVFADVPPPVTSTEPYFSHVNGVSPLLGLAAVLVAFATGRAPHMPTNLAQAATKLRPGLALTLMSPGTLPAGDCLLTATAFGGTNGAVIVRRAGRRAPSMNRQNDSEIVIAGMGAVSPMGAREGLLQGLAQPARPGEGSFHVEDAWLKPCRPGLNMARRERLVRMALLAVSEALDNAGVDVGRSERYGLLVGLSRGPVAAYERFFKHTLRGRFDASTGRALLRTGRFSVASEISYSFGIQGYSGAMAPGVHGGVQLLAHGAELLRATSDLDGLVVIAADEWTDWLGRMYAQLGLLGDGAAYDGRATGCVGGEGAAAILLVRRTLGDDRPGWARIAGTGFAGDTTTRPDCRGRPFQRAIATALTRAGRPPADIDFAIGQGCGWPAYDAREIAGLAPICANAPLTSVLPHTGLAESAGGLFAAIAAAAALCGRPLPTIRDKAAERRPIPGVHVRLVNCDEAVGDFRHGLLIGSSERGAHAAVVMSRMDA